MILACRSRERGEAALADVKRVRPAEPLGCCYFLLYLSGAGPDWPPTGHWGRCRQGGSMVVSGVPQESGSNQVVFMQLDLGSLKSVRSFAETFLKAEPRLDLLINNAGWLPPGPT